MGYTNYSTPVKPASFEAPLDLDLYAKGTLYKENLAKANLQDISSSYNNVFNIPTYGKDKEKIAELEGSLKNELSQMNLANLGNMETASQIKNLINKYSQSKDVMGIAQRYGSYQNELKKKEEAEAKGQTYVSPLLREAEKYYSSGEYLTDKRFNNAGWVSPDTTKAMGEAVKAVTKQQYDPKTGFVTKTAKPEDVAANFYERMKNNPNYQKDLEYGFEQETEGVNWQDNGQQFVQEKVNKLTQQYNEAVSDGNQEAALLAQHELNRLQDLADPSLIGEELKKQAFQNYINTQLERVGYANDVLDFEKIERDPIDMKLLEHKLKKQEDLYNLQLKTGVLPEKGESQAAYIQRLAQESQKRDLEIAQAKSDISLNRQKELETQRQEGRIATIEYKTKNGTIKIKDDGAKQIKLGNEFVDKKAVEDQIKSKDKGVIEKFINAKSYLFGLGDNTIDPEQAWNGGIRFETDKKTGVDYVVYNDDAIFEETFKVPVSELVKSLYDNDYKPGVMNSKGEYVNNNSLNVKVDQSNMPNYVTPDGKEVDVEGYTQEQINQAIQNGIIKLQ